MIVIHIRICYNCLVISFIFIRLFFRGHLTDFLHNGLKMPFIKNSSSSPIVDASSFILDRINNKQTACIHCKAAIVGHLKDNCVLLVSIVFFRDTFTGLFNGCSLRAIPRSANDTHLSVWTYDFDLSCGTFHLILSFLWLFSLYYRILESYLYICGMFNYSIKASRLAVLFPLTIYCSCDQY